MIVEDFLLSLSLCADCLAVALCSGVAVREMHLRGVAVLASVFSVIHMLFLTAGWLFGNLFVGLVSGISHVIGFILLVYVGISMLREGIRGDGEVRNLIGFRNVVLTSVATSIDALAVGTAKSMAGTDTDAFVLLAGILSAVTFVVVSIGIMCGRLIGSRTGRWAEIGGGLILVGIGVGVLF